jgi:hypothetical protein
MLRQLANTWRLVRPRAAAEARNTLSLVQSGQQRLGGELDELRQSLRHLRTQHKALVDDERSSFATLREKLDAMTTDAAAQMKALRDQSLRVDRREAQLRAIMRRDVELESAYDSLSSIIADERTAEHVRCAIAAPRMCCRPCPWMVIDDVLPQRVYDALITGLPPVEQYNHVPLNKGHLLVPFALAPAYSRRIWHYMVRDVVAGMIRPAVLARFDGVLRQFIAENFPAASAALRESLEFPASDGRILHRTRGYRIKPHRDPRWGFLTCILYLARPDDDERWGTQFYEVADDRPADAAHPLWIEEERCRQVADVTFRPNRLLVFLNSTGAHGASIPDNAMPVDLERYIYQFRIGPNSASIARLVATLPEAERGAWRGKVSDY